MATFTEPVRFDLLRVLQINAKYKTEFWARLDTVQAEQPWYDAVIKELDLFLAAEENPSIFLSNSRTIPAATTTSDYAYEPYLKKVDVIEFFEGKMEATYSENRDRLIDYLRNLIGFVPSDSLGSSGSSKYCFS